MPATILPVTFFGKWSLAVTVNNGVFDQRIRIQGSLNADGTLAAPIGAQIPEIDGTAWEVHLERGSDGGVGWQENIVQRFPSVTQQNGLTVTLYGVGDLPIAPPDVAVQFVYLDRQVNPQPFPPPFSFTLPPDSFRPPRPRPVCECCCKSPCCCGSQAIRGRRQTCCQRL